MKKLLIKSLILFFVSIIFCVRFSYTMDIELISEGYSANDSVYIYHEFRINDKRIKVISSGNEGLDVNNIIVINEGGNDTLFNYSDFWGLNSYQIFGKNDKKILVLDLIDNRTRVFNQICIFDPEKGAIPCIHYTMEPVYSNNDIPHFKRTIYSGRDEHGSGFYSYYCYKYENGKFIIENDYENISIRNIRPEFEKLDKSYSSDVDDLIHITANVMRYKEIILQFKIYDKESQGWDLFNKYYSGKDKEKFKKEIKESVDSRYIELLKPLDCE